MKSFVVLLSFASLAISLPSLFDKVQHPLGQVQHTTASGLDLDLSERRLIEVEGQSPIWVTELEKVSAWLRSTLTE